MLPTKNDTRITRTMLTVCCLVAIGGCSQQPTVNLPAKQAQAVTALESLGTVVTIRDDQVILIDFVSTQDIASAVVQLKPFVELKKINFSGALLTDDDLAHLTPLVHLEELGLRGTQVTNAGLKHITGFKKLQVLNLDNTTISDTGLVHLKDLNQLKRLHLNKTEVTNAGLSHLAGLEGLQSLLLYGTYVTPSGADVLRESLPDLEIVAPESGVKPSVTKQDANDL